MSKTEIQINAIKKAIAAGKCKNVYAAYGKIKKLQAQQAAENWNKFLSR